MKPLLYLVALFSVVSSVAADPSAISGHVRQADGQPVAGAQVALFAVSDLASGAVAQATTDDAGYFAFSLKALGGSPRPAGFVLGPNYPNPFNPSTIIPYQLPVATPVRLEVFNVLGQHVKTLVDGERPAGAHTALWDATDAMGQAVGAGVYFYRLSGGGAQWTRKMVLIDGQAGVATGGAGWTAAARPVATDTPVYRLTVSGQDLVTYVDPAFQVEVGMAPVDLVVEALNGRPPMKVAASGVFGDEKVASKSSNHAVTGTLTQCSGTRDATTGIVTVTMGGTVRAHEAVTNLILSGYANGSFVDIVITRSMSAGQSRNVSMSGIIFTDSNSLSCSIRMEWLDRPTAACSSSPDESPSVSDNTLTPGQFYSSATSTAMTISTTLRYYRSSNSPTI